MKLKHKVVATVRDENGNITDRRVGHNTVSKGSPSTANNGLVMMLDYITGKDEYYDSTAALDKMKLGMGTPSDSGLGTPTGTYKTTTFVGNIDITTLTAPKITLKGTWDSGDGALSGITEAGLFNNDTLGLFAYKTFSPALTKPAGGTLDMEWSITVN